MMADLLWTVTLQEPKTLELRHRVFAGPDAMAEADKVFRHFAPLVVAGNAWPYVSLAYRDISQWNDFNLVVAEHGCLLVSVPSR